MLVVSMSQYSVVCTRVVVSIVSSQYECQYSFVCIKVVVSSFGREYESV